MTDWATIAQVGTAGGTLVLALATFSSIRASNRSVQVAERSLLAAQPDSASAGMPAPDLGDFRPQQRDLYVPADQTGFWQARIREPDDPFHGPMRARVQEGGRVMIDVLYGDYEGTQRTIARFSLITTPEGEQEDPSNRAEVVRYWDLDGTGGRRDPSGGAPA
jgi:hypothetical protein